MSGTSQEALEREGETPKDNDRSCFISMPMFYLLALFSWLMSLASPLPPSKYNSSEKVLDCYWPDYLQWTRRSSLGPHLPKCGRSDGGKMFQNLTAQLSCPWAVDRQRADQGPWGSSGWDGGFAPLPKLAVCHRLSPHILPEAHSRPLLSVWDHLGGPHPSLAWIHSSRTLLSS